MANYSFFTFATDENSLAALAAEPRIGQILYTMRLYEHGKKNMRTSYRTLFNMDEQDDGKLEPVDVRTEQGAVIGLYFGHYYDSVRVGVDTPVPDIPSGHIVLPLNNDAAEKQAALSGSTLRVMIEAFLAAPENYGDKIVWNNDLMAGDNVQLKLAMDEEPVFLNDTDSPAPLRILKKTPFYPGDEGKIIDVSGPYRFPSDYQPPRRASHVARKAMVSVPPVQGPIAL